MNTDLKKSKGIAHSYHHFGRSRLVRINYDSKYILIWQQTSKKEGTYINLTKEQYYIIKNMLGEVENVFDIHTRSLPIRNTFHKTNSTYYRRVKNYLIKEKLYNIGGKK